MSNSSSALLSKNADTVDLSEISLSIINTPLPPAPDTVFKTTGNLPPTSWWAANARSGSVIMLVFGVFIIDSDISLKSTVSAFFESNADEELLIQQFLPLNGDIRVLVLNGRILGAMNREKVKNDFRSNASLGANVNEADISEEIKEMAINAAKAMGC